MNRSRFRLYLSKKKKWTSTQCRNYQVCKVFIAHRLPTDLGPESGTIYSPKTQRENVII